MIGTARFHFVALATLSTAVLLAAVGCASAPRPVAEPRVSPPLASGPPARAAAATSPAANSKVGRPESGDSVQPDPSRRPDDRVSQAGDLAPGVVWVCEGGHCSSTTAESEHPGDVAAVPTDRPDAQTSSRPTGASQRLSRMNSKKGKIAGKRTSKQSSERR